MPMAAVSLGATIHNSKVYICAGSADETGETDKETHCVLVYSTNEHKWAVLESLEQHTMSAIAVVNNHNTLIGGVDE